MKARGAVSFDFGQTLAELDHQMLAGRVAEHGVRLDPLRLAQETAAAWDAYGEAKRRGLTGRDAWCTFMRTLLSRAGHIDPTDVAEWLFDQQPTKNLWRKPVAGMYELAQEIAARGTPLAIVSNSEGRLAELVLELGWAELFPVVADSGRLGFEKPDPRIFEWAATRLAVPVSSLVHVGDAWEADVVGALGVGARAVWFPAADDRALSAEVRSARTPAEARAALLAFGVL